VIDKDCQWLATGRCFSPGIPGYSTNITDRHNTSEIVLKGALNTINQTKPNHQDINANTDLLENIDIGKVNAYINDEKIA
jgi:hypothetical protein